MKKIVFIGGVSEEGKIVGGETIKNQYFIEYLRKENIDFDLIDTVNWRKNKIKIGFLVIKSLISARVEKIILSCSIRGTVIFLKIYNMLKNCKKEVYYFSIGGRLTGQIKNSIIKIQHLKVLKEIHVETQSLKDELISFGLRNVHRTPNFKTFTFNPPKEKTYSLPLKCVFFSRVVPEKGVDLIIDAVKKINDGKTLVTVDFYGPVDEAYKNQFISKIEQERILRYKGVLNPKIGNTYEILSKYDLMLFPTYHGGEGFPGTIIDAYISGLPIIASDWKFNSEIVNNGVTGYIIKSQNMQELKNILGDIITDVKRLEEMRYVCINEAQKYLTNSVLGKVVNRIKI